MTRRQADAQRDFAAVTKAEFPHGVRLDRKAGHSRDDTSVVSTDPTMSKWCLGYGFHERHFGPMSVTITPE
jgi:hypothetical protein